MKSITKYIYLPCLIAFLVIWSVSCRSSGVEVNQNGYSIESDTGKVIIEYIAHASFILTYKKYSILLDPFADTVWISYSFPRDIEADAIFSTHPHYDHDGGIFRNLNPYWQGSIPFYQDPGTYELGGFKIRGLKGKHCDPYGKEFGQKNTIFIFDVAGIKIVHWGDNGPITDTLFNQLKNIDIIMLPIDDTYHILKADEIKEIIDRLQPKIVIPMHYKIAELEPTPGKPKNLGILSKYLENKSGLIRLESNIIELDISLLPDKLQYMVFQHSPRVK